MITSPAPATEAPAAPAVVAPVAPAPASPAPDVTTTATAPNAPPAEGATPPAAAPAPATVEVTADQITPEMLESLTPEQARALSLGQVPNTGLKVEIAGGEGRKAKGDVAVPVVEPVVPPAAPVAEVVPPVVPPVVEQPKGDEDVLDTPGLPKNFRLHTENPKQAAFIKAYKVALQANPDVNPAEVARLVGYEGPTAPAATGPTPGAESPAAVEDFVEAPELATARTELAAIEQQLTETAATEGLASPQYTDLIRQRTDRMVEIAKMEILSQVQAERQQEAARGQQLTARQAAKVEVLKDYPTANDGNSELGAEIERQFMAIEANPQHPDRARFAQDDGPAWLTRKAADALTARYQKTLGLTEAQAREVVKGKPIAEAKGPASVVPAPPVPAPAAPTPAPGPTPVPRTALVTNPGGPAAPAVTLTAAQVLEMAENDPKLRRQILGFNGDVTL